MPRKEENTKLRGLRPIGYLDQMERLWAIQADTDQKYLYELFIHVPENVLGAQIYLGTVAQAEGYQMNPNRIANALIQSEIVAQRVKRAPIDHTMYVSNMWKPYVINKGPA